MTAVLIAVVSIEIRGEASPVARGEELAQASGCYACHGLSERDERVNFRSSSSGRVRPRGLPTFWENGIDSGERLKEWIRDGVPEDGREKHEALLIQMPAYGDGYLSEQEIESIAAWILAKSLTLTAGMGNASLPMPDDFDPAELSRDQLLVLGDRLSRQQACYQCHGELGQGGVANPESFKEYIPGFFGSDFRQLTEGGDRDEIRHWIDHGRGLAIEAGFKGRLAKVYLEGQAIPMPAYRDLLHENEKEVLVDFLLLLNEMGPLGTQQLESFTRLISDHVIEEHRNNAE